jgi:RimJ/RimL family protein N-acetyltransferase
MAHPAFRLPYLTGTPDPKNQPVRPWVRSTDYVVKAMASRYFGRIAFGARRHWIMAIADADSGQFIGIVLLDGVARFPRGEAHGLLQRAFIEPHKNKADARVGDAEWGFFLHPDFWGQGIALQAIYALTAALGNAIVRRVFAETGADNHQAIRLLERAGLVRNDAKTIPASMSPRFEPDGRPIELVHYEQPPSHGDLHPEAPVRALLEDMERRRVVAPGWQSISAGS